MDWSPGAAIGVALAFLVVFWMLYDAICRIFGAAQKNGDAIVGALVRGAGRASPHGWPASGSPAAPPSCWWAR